MSYCTTAPGHPWHGPYHDDEYGFPTRDDAVLFERLALEINQAGLSWLTVLKKREAFFDAFRGFDPKVVARFGDDDRKRLLGDASIIRNRLKVAAVSRERAPGGGDSRRVRLLCVLARRSSIRFRRKTGSGSSRAASSSWAGRSWASSS